MVGTLSGSVFDVGLDNRTCDMHIVYLMTQYESIQWNVAHLITFIEEKLNKHILRVNTYPNHPLLIFLLNVNHKIKLISNPRNVDVVRNQMRKTKTIENDFSLLTKHLRSRWCVSHARIMCVAIYWKHLVT